LQGRDLFPTFVALIETSNIMKTTDILDYIETQGFNWRYSWRKDYGNGTELLEVKLYKSARHRKPVGFVQIGFTQATKEVIGSTITFANNSAYYDVETFNQLENAIQELKNHAL
jgi:hypothetical protein